jgi:hypothetical protein
MPLFNRNKPQEQSKQGRNLLTDSVPISSMPQEQQQQMYAQRTEASKPKITSESLTKANETLRKYKEGKANLEAKIQKEEEVWKLGQWSYYRTSGTDELRPKSAWLFNCIISKLADIMDGYPEANLLPKMPDDEQEAHALSEIVPVVLKENGFETTYHDTSLYTLKHGGGVYGVFWDGSKNDGLGDISIRKVDLLNLYWRGGVTDIQSSPNVFYTTLVDYEQLAQMYPQAEGVSGKSISQATYLYDDRVDTENMAVVVDWYYHTFRDGRRLLHYCKFVDNIVLFASENEPDKYPDGWYAHGEYPFVTQALFPIEGSICGMGYIDIGLDTQMYIDTLDSAILTNSIVACQPKYVFNDAAGINEAEFLDQTKPITHASGNLGEDAFRVIQSAQLSDVYVAVRNNLIEELKETTGNRDVNNGGTTSGVTAASAIAAMQEQSGKVSRTHNQVFYTTFERVITQVVELIRQFYDQPRQFRIVSDMGESQFVSYSNANIKPRAQQLMGVDLGIRQPVFDIEISAQKASTYNKMSQNELALQLFGVGVFNPQMADQALALLGAMDFNHKEDVMQTVSQNGTMLQMLMHFQQIALALAQEHDPAMAEQIAMMIMQYGGQVAPTSTGAGGEMVKTDSAGNIKAREHPFVEKARNEAQQSTQAR